MNKHYSKRFDDDLKHLWKKMIDMVSDTEEQMVEITKYLTQAQQENRLQRVMAIEAKIDQEHLSINDECIRLTATRAPVAVDLRYLSMANRVASDVERIGDELHKIARILLQTAASEPANLWQEIIPTANMAHKMIQQIIQILLTLDLQEAMRVLDEDQHLDANYLAVTHELITRMQAEPRLVEQGVNALFVAKALERVGDHCMNIAEAFIYYEKACDVRHKSPDERHHLLDNLR